MWEVKVLDGIQVNPFLLLSRDSGPLKAGGGRRAAIAGSTFHLSNRSGETLTRLTAAQGLCSIEQIESIVFFFFFFLFFTHWRAGGGWALLGMRGRGLDPAWYGMKAKGCVRKLPLPPDLKGSPNCRASKLKAVLGGGSVRGER